MLAVISLLPSVCLVLAALGALLDFSFPPDLSRLASMGSEILDRQDRPLAFLPAAGGIWRFRSDNAPPLFTDLLIAVEDRRFWHHPGVDPIALTRATAQLLRSGHTVSGGSTLAMQAARLLEPRPRTIRSKLIEIARAVQLEAHYGRRGVLDIWLTLAPFGGNIEGIRAGSLAWFGVPPEALEPAQAALLVAIPRRPERLRPDRHATAATAIRDRVLAIGSAGEPVRCRTRTHARADRPHPAAPPRAAARGIAAPPAAGPHNAGPAAAGRTRTPRARATGDPAATGLARYAGGRCALARDPCALRGRLARRIPGRCH